MNKQEYEALQNHERTLEKILSVEDLENKNERTLLFGYTCDGDSWHVYIKNNQIRTIIYSTSENPKEVTIFTNQGFVPNKRLYPKCCDYEFCRLLKDKEVALTFTIWQDREEKTYYGKII